MSNVNHPSHYGGDTVYECIKVLKAWGLMNNACRFNTIKYLSRAGKKGDLLEDLEKAQFYLNYEIQMVKEARKAEQTSALISEDVRPPTPFPQLDGHNA